jgi:hypothetical protein
LKRIEVDLGIDLGVLTDNQVAQFRDAFAVWIYGQTWARKKFEVDIDLTKPGPAIVEDILRAADGKKIGGLVAQHLVEARLARRFPLTVIETQTATTADGRLRREARITVGNTVFHVSVVPTSDHLQRCAENLVQGQQPYMIVPAARVAKARAFAEDKKIEDKVAIVAIETFVGQGIDEMGEFQRSKVKVEIAALLNECNRRMAEAETDQSVHISIPSHLAK